MAPHLLGWFCGSSGGLLLFAFFPSKRGARFFPLPPPLCVLVAAQAALFLSHEKYRARNFRWAAAILAMALLFSVSYEMGKVVIGYRNHRDALSSFGRRVREEAAKHHWRYEAIGSTDEGLPLYLRRPHFLKSEIAIEEWNSGKIDALAVPANKAPQLMRELHDSTRRFESAQRKSLRRPKYVLLTH